MKSNFGIEIKVRLAKALHTESREDLQRAFDLVLFRRKRDFRTHYNFLVRLLQSVYGSKISIDFKRGSSGFQHIYRIERLFSVEELEYLNTADLCKGNNKNVLFRVAFLYNGFITAPEKGYQAGFSVKDGAVYDFLCRFLYENGINYKVWPKARGYLIRITKKSGLLRLLNLIHSSYGILYLENMDLMREVYNRANRETNLVLANLARQANFAERVNKKIEYLINSGHFLKLPDNLKELAMIRYENPYSSLEELIQKYEIAITKSTLSKRLRKIEKIADNIIKREGQK